MQAPDSKNLLDLELEKSGPSLFTVFTLEHEKLGNIVITAKDVVAIAENIIARHVADIRTTLSPPKGVGTKDNPFFLNSPAEWLFAAVALKKDTGLVYYNIGGKIVEINLENAYASDHGANFEFLKEINAIGLQMLANIIQSENKEKFRSFFSDITHSDRIFSKLGPLIFFMIQQFGSKVSDTRRIDPKRVDAQGKNLLKTLEKPPYSELDERHTEAVDPVPNFQRFTTEMSKQVKVLPAAMMGDIKRDLANPNSDFSKMLNSPGGIIGTIEPIVESLVAAFPPQDQRKISEFTDYLMQGLKQLLPAPGQLTADNVEAFAAEKWSKIQQLGKNEPALEEWFSKDFGSLMTDLLNSIGDKNISQNDVAKLVAFANELVLQEIRLTLKNQIKTPNNYLPVTLAAWLLSETSRYPASYIGSLMILDLIEAQEMTPFAGEVYTFSNAMSHLKSRHSFVDAHGLRYRGTCGSASKCKECEQFNKDKANFKKSIDALTPREIKDMIVKVFNNDRRKFSFSQQLPVLIATLVNKAYSQDVTTETVAGYHPMVHKNSFNEQNERSHDKLVLSQQKLANIIFQWLSLQLRNSGLKIKLSKVQLSEELMKRQRTSTIAKDFLESLIGPLVEARVRNFELMRAGDSNVDKIIETFCAKYGIAYCKQKLATKKTDSFYQELLRATIALSEAGESAIIAESEKDKKKESEEALTRHAAEFGFVCKNVAGDGRCFFHAVSDQLDCLVGMSFTADQLIEIASEHIFINFDSHYKEFMVEGETEAAFLKRISTPGEWADHIMIIALSRALNINIVIIRSDGADPNITERYNPLTTVYLGYEIIGEGNAKKGYHYQSLRIDRSFVATRNINNYLGRNIDPDDFYRLQLPSFTPLSNDERKDLQSTSVPSGDSSAPHDQSKSAKPTSPFALSLSGEGYNPMLVKSAGSVAPAAVKPEPGTTALTDEEIRNIEIYAALLRGQPRK